MNPELSIQTSCTDLPIEHITFRSSRPIYWVVEMLKFDKESGILDVCILNYDPESIIGFEEQNAKYPVGRIHFGKPDWNQLEGLLSSYQKNKLYNKVINLPDLKDRPRPEPKLDLSRNPDAWQPLFPSDEEEKYSEFNFKEAVEVDWKDLRFVPGGVTFEYYYKRVNDYFPVLVQNEDALPEFELIKFWFAKRLKCKKVPVTVSICILDNKVKSLTAESKVIAKINQSLIDSFKFQSIRSLPSLKSTSGDFRQLLNISELSELLNTVDGVDGLFNLNEADVISMFLDKLEVRNRQQLKYLAGKLHSNSDKIRFTLNPMFGFLFTHHGLKCSHYIWERLDSHATYVWSIEMSEMTYDKQMLRIEQSLTMIRHSGRPAYRSAYSNGSTDSDLVFCIIDHKYASSPVMDHFPFWKSKLDQLLI